MVKLWVYQTKIPDGRHWETIEFLLKSLCDCTQLALYHVFSMFFSIDPNPKPSWGQNYFVLAAL